MTDATITERGTLTMTQYPTWWDGQRGPNSSEIYYTIITSHGEHIYLAENTWNPVGGKGDGVLTGRVAKIRKSDHVEVGSAGLGVQAWDGEPGHTPASVGVSGAGTVLARRGGHTYPLDAYVATGGDLSTAAALTNPAGADTRGDYRKMYRGPDGTLYLNVRGNTNQGVLYRWDESSSALVPVGNLPLVDQGSDGCALVRLAWSPDGTTMYAVAERSTGYFAWPYRDVGVMQSSDDGATWKDLDGASITLPADWSETSTVWGSSAGNISNSTIVATATGPVVVGAWKNATEGDAYMSLWVGAWNGTAWDQVRLLRHADPIPETPGQAYPPYRVNHDTTYHDGKVYVVVRDPGENDLCLYVAAESDLTLWDRWVLDTSGSFHGAQFDQHALADDGLIRIYPVAIYEDPSGYVASNPQQSKIWEVAVPDDWSELTTTADITATTHTDEDLDAASWYRYRVATMDGGISSPWSAWVQVAPIPTGTATGSTSWAGAATGTAPALPERHGTATGNTAWTGAADGRRAAHGSASGHTEWAGAATGRRDPRATATGTTAWTGTASGTAPDLDHRTGHAAGATAWTGTATGRMHPKATAAGAVAWTGSATGRAPAVDQRTGTASGSTAWAGSAHGRRDPLATATGTVHWTGTAHGTTTRAGQAAGFVAWTGTATGFNPSTLRDVNLTLGPLHTRGPEFGPLRARPFALAPLRR